MSGKRTPVYLKEKNPQFYIKNELAFTCKDDILITSIYAEGFGEEATEESLKKYFEDFGEVIAITFNEVNLNDLRSANVLFKSPTAAAKVLSFKGYHNFKVNASDCWLQPLLKDFDEQTTVKQSKFLTDLDDDTLFQIISQLNLKDQLALVCSHDRFLPAFQIYARLKLKAVNTDDLKWLSLYQTQQFFIVAENYIEKFELRNCERTGYFSTLCQLLSTYCVNLKELWASQLGRYETDDFNKLLRSKRKLKTLDLYDCSFKDECSATISNLLELEQFSLDYCDFVTGSDLILPNLTELHINECENLVVIYLKNALINMPALRTLELSDRYGNLNPIVENLSQYCPNLEVVCLDCRKANYECVAELKKLKSIEFVDIGSRDFLPKFVHQCANHIETFGIDCNKIKNEHKQLMSEFKNLKILRFFEATDDHLRPLHTLCSLVKIDLSESYKLTNDAVLELVKCCYNLKYVYIQNTVLNNEFAEALLPIITKGTRPNGQLIFYAKGSRIVKFKLPREYFSTEIKSMVKFIFEKARRDYFFKWTI